MPMLAPGQTQWLPAPQGSFFPGFMLPGGLPGFPPGFVPLLIAQPHAQQTSAQTSQNVPPTFWGFPTFGTPMPAPVQQHPQPATAYSVPQYLYSSGAFGSATPGVYSSVRSVRKKNTSGATPTATPRKTVSGDDSDPTPLPAPAFSAEPVRSTMSSSNMPPPPRPGSPTGASEASAASAAWPWTG